RLSLDICGDLRYRTGVPRPPDASAAERASQDADPHASFEGRLPSAREDTEPHRGHVPSETLPPPVLDPLRVGGRKGAHGVRGEGPAPRHDEGAWAAHGGRRVLPLEREGTRTPATLGRRPSPAAVLVLAGLAAAPHRRRLGEDAPPLVRLDDTVDRDHVGGLACVDLLRLAHVPDSVEGADHDALELLVD